MAGERVAVVSLFYFEFYSPYYQAAIPGRAIESTDSRQKSGKQRLNGSRGDELETDLKVSLSYYTVRLRIRNTSSEENEKKKK